ncbi:MAG: 5,5'-dehydrodivanillate O-demethylase [Alphaproteobacteria bacterium]|jgi:5,5'-dehydrodivanillate O-demethylase
MVMTPEQNERLTRVGPGTPGGNMLRYYWWPIAFTDEVQAKPFPVKLLGEDLIMFRDGNGKVGLLERACTHRSASLALGRVEGDGIRCCYHGWKFDATGRCLEMPAEPDGTPLKDEVRQKAYHTEEVAGLIFAYMGPEPVPLFAKIDLLFREDMNREVYAKNDFCNWLQRAENGHDPAHLGILHAAGYPQIAFGRPNIDRERLWYGFRTASQFPGQMLNVSHQIFPSHTRRIGARTGEEPRHYIHYRVPIDDTLTTTFYIRAEITREGPWETKFTGREAAVRGEYGHVDDGWWGIPSREQDRAAQESQGLIFDRSKEQLGTTDENIALFRRTVEESIAAVEQGRDPIGVLREPPCEGIIRFDATKNFGSGEMKAPDMIGA